MRFAISMAALIGACLLAAPAHAAPAVTIKDFTLPVEFGDRVPLIKVQSMLGGPASPAQNSGSRQRGGGAQNQGGGGGRQFNRGGQRGGGGGYRGHGGGGDDGAGVAAGVLGGLLLGTIIANEAQRGQGVDYCMRRYRSYDPQSMTYLGSDGRRHRCP